jgi:hypothetical protein
MIPKIGDSISINSGEVVGTIIDICSDSKTAKVQGIDTNWIWIEYKQKGRKKRCRIPECNLSAYNPVIIPAK